MGQSKDVYLWLYNKRYCENVHMRNSKNLFWYTKIQVRCLINENKSKSKSFLASSLPHNICKEKLTEMIKQIFN